MRERLSAEDGSVMKFAYADPPYIGQAVRHYGRGGTSKRRTAADKNAAEVDHQALLDNLIENYQDGWALSCSSPTLGKVLRMCDAKVRIGAWVKTFAVFKPGVNPGYCWEPVLFCGGRKLGRGVATVRDWISCPVKLQGFIGAKPEPVCFWIFQMLGMENGDELADLFPGSGAVSRAWDRYRQQMFVA